MKIAYLDCSSGISGDMTLGALVDAGVPLEKLDAAVQSLGVNGLHLSAEEVKRAGFRATKVDVHFEPEHVHRHLSHITAMIDGSTGLTERQKELSRRIFTLLARAEAKVHGTTPEKVHFHEVGAADSIADIVGSAVGWDLLGVDRIVASPIPTGTGKVKIAHGLCSIPAPATAELLRGIPLAESSVPFELTTPTGAALLGVLVEHYGPIPPMRIETVAYGAGGRDLSEQPNVLRLLVGQADATDISPPLWIIETNLDDTPGEWIGYCIERLWETDAVDVWCESILMKKHRPGVKLSVLCEASAVETIERLLLSETTTLGVRRWPVQRTVLPRRSCEVQTPHGPITGKLATLPSEEERFTPEYESARRIALEAGVPLHEIYAQATQAWRNRP